jgi:hypothetical protein
MEAATAMIAFFGPRRALSRVRDYFETMMSRIGYQPLPAV